MQSDPGAGTPHTGDDDDVWRDLVARLEEADDAFLEAQNPTADSKAEGSTDDKDAHDGGTPVPHPAASDAVVPRVNEPRATEPKTVIDFDPLGVWHDQEAPAPRELAADSRNHAGVGGAGEDFISFGPRDYEADDDEEGFVPEELPSLRNSDPAIMMSWIGAAGAPLFLVFSAIFWRQIPTLLVMAVIVAFIAGTGYLLYRLPNHRDHDSGDGAVV